MATQSTSIITLNCQGLTGNLAYVDYLVNTQCDIMFLNEHWLKPSELHTINEVYKNNNLWSNLKSSIPADIVLEGRPFGGVGFICRSIPGCSIKDVPCLNERVSVIQLVNNGKVTLTIIGVYMPHHCHNSSQIYSDVLDNVHGIIHDVNSPIVLVGDMNASLPNKQHLCMGTGLNRDHTHLTV